MQKTLDRPMSHEFGEQPQTTMDVQVLDTRPEQERHSNMLYAVHAVWRFMTGPHDASGHPSDHRAVPVPAEAPVISDNWYKG